jgi:hypothetical protein
MHTITRRLAGVALSLASVTGLFVATAPQAEAATACANQVFSYSLTTKTCVKYLQTLVNQIFAMDTWPSDGRHITVDGKYGTDTKSAVTKIEKYAVLYKPGSSTPVYAKVDGVTGVQMWTMLCGEGSGSAKSSAGCAALNTPYDAIALSESPH